jgi:hypothetical protein
MVLLPTPRYIALRIAAAALVSLAVVGCGETSTGPTNATMAGVWNLETINGSPLPVVVSGAAPTRVEVVSGVLTFTIEGTFTQVTKSRVTVSGVTTDSTDTDSGTYTVSGPTLTVKFAPDNATGTATVYGDAITVYGGGAQSFFRKQGVPE